MNTLKLSDTYRVSLSMGKKKIGFRSNLVSSRETGHRPKIVYPLSIKHCN